MTFFRGVKKDASDAVTDHSSSELRKKPKKPKDPLVKVTAMSKISRYAFVFCPFLFQEERDIGREPSDKPLKLKLAKEKYGKEKEK